MKHVVFAGAMATVVLLGAQRSAALPMDGLQGAGRARTNQSDSQGPSQPTHGSPVFGRAASEWWRDAEVQKRLELRPRQIADIEHSWKEFVTASQTALESLAKRWQAIDQAVADQSVTPDELRHMMAVAESLRADLNTSRVVTLYKIFLVLDPVQRVGVREWLARPAEPSRGRRGN